MANWSNDKFKAWLKEIDASSLSQEQLKKEAIVFSEEFAEVDKKTITKVIDDFEKEHKKVLADVSHSVFEEMGGEEGKRRGRKDVPPKDYFPEDENMLRIVVREKKRDYVGKIPKLRGGSDPNPLLDVYLPSYFWHAKMILRC